MSYRTVFVRAGSRIFGGYVRDTYVDNEEGVLYVVVLVLRVTRFRVISGEEYTVIVDDSVLFHTLSEARDAVNNYNKNRACIAALTVLRFAYDMFSL